MRDVFSPLNERAAELIITHADLLDSAEIDASLLQLVSHVSAGRIAISRWQQGDFSSRNPITYPDEIHAAVTEDFLVLKQRQAKLLGQPLLSKRASSRL